MPKWGEIASRGDVVACTFSHGARHLRRRAHEDLTASSCFEQLVDDRIVLGVPLILAEERRLARNASVNSHLSDDAQEQLGSRSRSESRDKLNTMRRWRSWSPETTFTRRFWHPLSKHDALLELKERARVVANAATAAAAY